MKKLIAVAILSLVLLTAGHSQPVVEPTIVQTFVKINENTVEITTTTTIERVIQYDRAVIQTELDHIPDRRAEAQAQLDKVDAREAELINILKVFE